MEKNRPTVHYIDKLRTHCGSNICWFYTRNVVRGIGIHCQLNVFTNRAHLAVTTEVLCNKNRTGPGPLRTEQYVPASQSASASVASAISKSTIEAPTWLRSFCIHGRSGVVRIQSLRRQPRSPPVHARIDCNAKMNFPYDVAVDTRVRILYYQRMTRYSIPLQMPLPPFQPLVTTTVVTCTNTDSRFLYI